MSFCYTFVKSTTEPLSGFNERLAKMCQTEDNPITNFELAVVAGQPVVTLISELAEATQEDVDEDDTITLGELLPASEPMIVQVCQVEAAAPEQAKASEARLEKVYRRFQGDVIRNISAKGTIPVIIPVPDEKGAIVGHVAGLEEVLWIGVGLLDSTEET